MPQPKSEEDEAFRCTGAQSGEDERGSVDSECPRPGTTNDNDNGNGRDQHYREARDEKSRHTDLPGHPTNQSACRAPHPHAGRPQLQRRTEATNANDPHHSTSAPTGTNLRNHHRPTSNSAGKPTSSKNASMSVERRTIPPAPPRQFFLATNSRDDPYAGLLGADAHTLNAQHRPGRHHHHHHHRHRRLRGARDENGNVKEAEAKGKQEHQKQTTGSGCQPHNATAQSTAYNNSIHDITSPASGSAVTLPPVALSPVAAAPLASGGEGNPMQRGKEEKNRAITEAKSVDNGNYVGGGDHCRNAHMPIGLPRHFSRRFYEPVELQVESLSSFMVKMVFALWYLTFIACIVVEVIPQAQWSVVNLCGRVLQTDLRHWDRWSSTCATQELSKLPSASAGAVDITWSGDDLGFLNDNLKIYRRVVLSLPRSEGQTAKTQIYHLHAEVSMTALDGSGAPIGGTSTGGRTSTYDVELKCEREHSRCKLVRLPEEMVLMHPDTTNAERVSVTLLALPPELADAVTQRSAAVGIVYQKRAYTLGSLIWRYAFLLISFFHLCRFIACRRYTATLYEQSWVIVLQLALFWYLDPLYACNIVTQPLPLILAFIEFRVPTYFITITIAFMFSTMTASMSWSQHRVPGTSSRKKKESKSTTDVEHCNEKEGRGDDSGEEVHSDGGISSDSDSSSSCSTCEEQQKWPQRTKKSLAMRLWTALFTSPNVYDPPAWTKVVTITYIVAVFALDIIDAAVAPEQWSLGSNEDEKFQGMYWAVIALLLFGAVVCFGMLLYLRSYLGSKPYLESRPQQLACRVFLVVFLTTVVYYIIHCFVFYFRYNVNYAATASRTPFVQLPAIMIACGFTNIMTLVYTSRSRHEGVPIHPTDSRWKFMVWPDTWYRWLARHGGSQYIFHTEEEETRFYRMQLEFRTRQFLAKQKRKHQRQHDQEYGSRSHRASLHSHARSKYEDDSFGAELSWLTENDDILTLPTTQQAVGTTGQHNGDDGVTTIREDRELVVGENKANHDNRTCTDSPHKAQRQDDGGATPAQQLLVAAAPAATTTARDSPAHAPADYRTQRDAESPTPPPEKSPQPSPPPPPSLFWQHKEKHGEAGAGKERETHPTFLDNSLNDTGGDNSDDARKANTLPEKDLCHLQLAPWRMQERNRSAVLSEDEGPGALSMRSRTFTAARPPRGMSTLGVSGSHATDDVLFHRMYGNRIMNMDKFSTYFLADGGESSGKNSDGRLNGTNPMRGDLMNSATFSRSRLGAGDPLADSSALYRIEGPARRWSRLQQHSLEATRRTRDDLSVSFACDTATEDDHHSIGRPRRSQSQLVPGHSRSAVFLGVGLPNSMAARPTHRRSQSSDAGLRSRGASHFNSQEGHAPRAAYNTATAASMLARRCADSAKDADRSSAGVDDDKSRQDDGDLAALRAYEVLVPDQTIDDSDASEKRRDRSGSHFLRSFVRARDKLGDLIGTAERHLLEKPMRNLNKLEREVFDAAYRPFQSADYLPFFNLETALDCYNLSWEAYGVDESAGDAAIETGLKVAPANVPKAAVHGVKKVFCGCCAAPESDEEEEEAEEEVDKAEAGENDQGERLAGPPGGEATGNASEIKEKSSRENTTLVPPVEGTGAEQSERETVVDVVEPAASSAPSEAGDENAASSSTTVSVPVEAPLSPASATAPVAPTAADSNLLPINCEKYGFKLLYVTEVKEVQVLICRMDTDEPEHQGKSPRLVIAFRGTANMSNAKYDANMHRVVWREMEEPLPESDVTHNSEDWHSGKASTLASTVHKAYLGCASCCKAIVAKTSWRPTCHAGFLAIWRAMQPRVMPRIIQFLKDSPDTVYRVFTTGHSLGGALASLCAYSTYRALLKMNYPIPDITVYTYGQPRMGNRTFQKLYNKAVPRSFRIMNESDMVVTFTMFGGTHVGVEVNIDRNGNFIVKPTDMEKLFKPTKGRGISIMNHLMSNYGVSMNAVAQRTTCPARGLSCYLTADPEKIRAEKAKEEAREREQDEL